MTVVCITGMHRSGTSMVARMLNLSGIYLGAEEDMLPAAPDNLEGFWENKHFVDINEKIFQTLGGRWDAPPIIEPGWELSEGLSGYYQEAENIIKKMSPIAFWGWKDPRNSLTLPFWQRLIHNLKVIVCLRNPLEVAHSLAKRDQIRDIVGLDLWHTYNFSLLSSVPAENRLITHYDTFFHDPYTELSRLLRFVGLDTNDEVIEKACVATMPSLRHNRAALESLITVGSPLKVVNLYAEMCSQAGQVFWDSINDTARNEALSNNVDSLVEYNLLNRLTEKDPVVQILTEYVVDKAQTIQTLSSQILEKEKMVKALTKQAQTLTRQVSERDKHIEALYTSISWRITA